MGEISSKAEINGDKIVKNSGILYIRMLFTMWLNLYATRLVLSNLGVEDMGIYSVVGSVVAIFSIFVGGITNTVQRFLSYELGREDSDTNRMFCSCLNIVIILSILVLVLLETCGLWFLYNKVNISPLRLDDAMLVYQFSVVTCIINILSIPYNALIIAHEKMDVFAYISIIQVILAFAVAYCLSYFSHSRLIYYAFFMAIISLLIRLLYQIYCYLKFRESHYHFVIDRLSLKQIGKFAGIATSSGIMEAVYNQGIVFVINWSFGVALNAVYGIALQLKNSVLSFSFNIFKAIAPQITKTYASHNYEDHCKLVYSGSKMEIFMMLFIIIPFFCRTEYILKIWLGDVPNNMVVYSQSMILVSLIYALFEPIRASVLASNCITKFMLIPNALSIFLLIPCYFLSKLLPYPYVFAIAILGTEILVCIIRIYYAIPVTPLDVSKIIRDVLVPVIIVALICGVISSFLSGLFPENLLGLMAILALNSVVLMITVYLFGTNSSEKQIINKLFFIFLKIK